MSRVHPVDLGSMRSSAVEGGRARLAERIAALRLADEPIYPRPEAREVDPETDPQPDGAMPPQDEVTTAPAAGPPTPALADAAAMAAPPSSDAASFPAWSDEVAAEPADAAAITAAAALAALFDEQRLLADSKAQLDRLDAAVNGPASRLADIAPAVAPPPEASAATAETGFSDFDPPPMIIERAQAEMLTGPSFLYPGPAQIRPAARMPAFLTGVVLSLLFGAALFMVRAGG